MTRRPKGADGRSLPGGLTSSGGFNTTTPPGSSAGGGGGAGTPTGPAQEALHALEADHAKEATHASSAAALDADSPTRADFLSALAADTAAGHITFADGLTTAQVDMPGYTPGIQGGRLWIDADGLAHVATDFLTVNRRMEVSELQIQEQTHIGGSQILSPAAMRCMRVIKTAGERI